MHYLIYQITNIINGKIYIGKHKTSRIDDDYFGSGKLLKFAFAKHGIENFVKTILFRCANDEEMNLLEKMVVDEDFCKRQDTYNLKVGGEGGGQKGIVRSEETKKKMKEAQNKIDHSYLAEVGKSTRFNGNQGQEFRYTKGHVPWDKGIKRKPSDFDKLRKEVLQFSKDGKLLNEFDSLKTASEKLNIPKSSISYCCKRRYKTAGGFVWRYKEDLFK